MIYSFLTVVLVLYLKVQSQIQGHIQIYVFSCFLKVVLGFKVKNYTYPRLPLLRINSREIKAYVLTTSNIQTFIAALYTIEKKLEKKLSWSSTGE